MPEEKYPLVARMGHCVYPERAFTTPCRIDDEWVYIPLDRWVGSYELRSGQPTNIKAQGKSYFVDFTHPDTSPTLVWAREDLFDG